MTPEMTMENCPDRHLCPEVIEHNVRIEGLDKTTARLERRLDALLLTAIGSLATSTGTLLVLLLKR